MKEIVDKLIEKNLFKDGGIVILNEEGYLLFSSDIEMNLLKKHLSKEILLGEKEINRENLFEIDYPDLVLKLAYAKLVLEDKELTLKFIKELLETEPDYDIAVIYSFYESDTNKNIFKFKNYISDKVKEISVSEDLMFSDYGTVYISSKDSSIFKLDGGGCMPIKRYEFDIKDEKENFLFEHVKNLYNKGE